MGSGLGCIVSKNNAVRLELAFCAIRTCSSDVVVSHCDDIVKVAHAAQDKLFCCGWILKTQSSWITVVQSGCQSACWWLDLCLLLSTSLA